MSQTEVASNPEVSTSKALQVFVRFIVGPLAFLLVQAIPLAGLKPQGHLALSCYAWLLAWWVATPVPWAVSGFLPLVLLPFAGAMTFVDVAALYGQRILPFLLGVMLFGHAFRKYGLARRISLKVLSIPGLATSGSRLVLLLLIISAIVSSFMDDAATIAIMIPIAMSVAKFVSDEHAKLSGAPSPRLMEASAFAVLYGSAAGGMATPAGVPFKAITIALLDQLTGYKISFAQWTATGVIISLATIPVYYLVLRWMAPTEVKSIPDGSKYFKMQQKALGPMSRGEKNVSFILIVMFVLWFLPAFVTIRALDIWMVPAVAIMLLFVLPVNAKRGEMTLTSKDFQEGVAWNLLFLVVSGTAMAGALVKLGITDWFAGIVRSGVSAATLPWFAGVITQVLSTVTSGGAASTTIVSTILFPIAKELGYNPAILARVISGNALAVTFPWAGAASASAFASGEITLGRMFRVGLVATILTVIVITGVSMIVVPALGAFTAP